MEVEYEIERTKRVIPLRPDDAVAECIKERLEDGWTLITSVNDPATPTLLIMWWARPKED